MECTRIITTKILGYLTDISYLSITSTSLTLSQQVLFFDKKKESMHTIIIQETDQAVLDVLKEALSQENYKVYALQQCDENFMELIENTRPHVIMLDYRLAGAQCLKIFMEIKKTYPHLPLIALSCNHNINTIAPAIGFDDYIEKPFDLTYLYQTLRKYIPKPVLKKRVPSSSTAVC